MHESRALPLVGLRPYLCNLPFVNQFLALEKTGIQTGGTQSQEMEKEQNDRGEEWEVKQVDETKDGLQQSYLELRHIAEVLLGEIGGTVQRNGHIDVGVEITGRLDRCGLFSEKVGDIAWMPRGKQVG